MIPSCRAWPEGRLHRLSGRVRERRKAVKRAAIVLVAAMGILLAGSLVFAAGHQTGAICTAVVDRACEGDGSAFPADVGKVFAHTRILGMEVGGSVVHRWIYGDRTMAEVTLSVGGPDWRTWSSKNIDPLWTGSWKVEVIDSADGSVIETLEFLVGE